VTAKSSRNRTRQDIFGGQYIQSDSAGGRTGTVRMPTGCTRWRCTLA